MGKLKDSVDSLNQKMGMDLKVIHSADKIDLEEELPVKVNRIIIDFNDDEQIAVIFYECVENGKEVNYRTTNNALPRSTRYAIDELVNDFLCSFPEEESE